MAKPASSVVVLTAHCCSARVVITHFAEKVAREGALDEHVDTCCPSVRNSAEIFDVSPDSSHAPSPTSTQGLHSPPLGVAMPLGGGGAFGAGAFGRGGAGVSWPRLARLLTTLAPRKSFAAPLAHSSRC